MLKQPQTTRFVFVLDNLQIFNNLDAIKMDDYQRFVRIGQVGKSIQQLAKQDDSKGIGQLVEKNCVDLQFMRMEIEDSFVSAMHLRNEAVIEYFLVNGLAIEQIMPDAVISVCYALQYLKNDPPIDLLRLILQYGANVRFAEQTNSDTPLHIAVKSGDLQFVKQLISYGADINAVNDDKKTPLGLAIANKCPSIVQLLKSLNASEKWNQ